MQATFNEVERAFVDGRITFDDVMTILIDNFGLIEAMRIMEHNLGLAMKEKSIMDSL